MSEEQIPYATSRGCSIRPVWPFGHVPCLSERYLYSLVFKVFFHMLGEEQRGRCVYIQSSGIEVEEWPGGASQTP